MASIPEENKSINSTVLELRNRGIITICGEVDKSSIERVIQDLLYINTLKKPAYKAVQLILNSVGGSTAFGFMLIDLIEYSRIPVYITGLGICASMGLLILCAGEKGHRVITPNTALLSHQYSWGNRDKYSELVATRKEQDRHNERFVKHYLKHTKLNRKQINNLLLPKTDVWLSAKQAKKYGLVDKVVLQYK